MNYFVTNIFHLRKVVLFEICLNIVVGNNKLFLLFMTFVGLHTENNLIFFGLFSAQLFK
jgi:hypothetical protein